MSSKKQSLQDFFLNSVRKNRINLTVFLMNGIKLQGHIIWFDNFSLLLSRDQKVQLVYKHAISTIVPNELIELPTYSEDDDSDV